MRIELFSEDQDVGRGLNPKPDLVARLVEEVPFTEKQEFYSPGFGAQKGDPTRFPALKTHHLIMGRSLLGADDPLEKLMQVEAQLGMGD